jgi:uncharacterized protein with ParB-like and HNH nuclease domain
MATGILPPELKSIEQLLTLDARLSVPLYQRNFAWTSDETTEFWEDILDASDRKSDYFLGTIVLQKKGLSEYQIIDGQQRLACLTMLFSAIRNIFKTNNDDRAIDIYSSFLGAKDFSKNSIPRPKLVLNTTNNEIFVKIVIESADKDEVSKVLRSKGIPDSNKLLLQAYKFFLEKLQNEYINRGTKAENFIVNLIDFLRASVKFITIPVNSEEDANLFFEALNARGKELAVSDLVKNRLYFEIGEPHISRAQKLWEQMENNLTKSSDPTSIPEYVRHYWIAKKADLKNISVREKQLYGYISSHVKGNKTISLQLLEDLSKSSHDYASISDYSLWPDDPEYNPIFAKTLNELKLFRVSQCDPLLLNAIQNFKYPKEIAKTFRTVANFSFRYFIIGNQSPGNLERETGKIALGIRDGSITTSDDIAEAFLAINPDKNFRSDFSLASVPRSRARIARYILAKIENHISQKKEKTVNPDDKTLTLEHILPQNFGKIWNSYFTKGYEPADYVDRIGNLTLLTQKINSDAADKSFPDKQQIAFQSSDLLLNSELMKLSKWGEPEIESRQDALAKIALEVWKLK